MVKYCLLIRSTLLYTVARPHVEDEVRDNNMWIVAMLVSSKYSWTADKG